MRRFWGPRAKAPLSISITGGTTSSSLACCGGSLSCRGPIALSDATSVQAPGARALHRPVLRSRRRHRIRSRLLAERSAARLAHQSGGLGVPSSNLGAPTILIKHLEASPPRRYKLRVALRVTASKERHDIRRVRVRWDIE